MKLLAIFFLFLCVQNLSASDLGDSFLNLGNKINSTNQLTADQKSQLWDILAQAEMVIETGSSSSEYICIDGRVYGPNNFEKWSGRTSGCEDPSIVLIGIKYACVSGTLYGLSGISKWTGSSYSCNDPRVLRIGNNFACASGTVYGPNGFEKWLGNSYGCESVTLD